MNLFESAARKKYRFPSVKGPLTTENLFELPLQSKTGFDLDNVAKEIHARIKEEGETSFVDKSTNAFKNQLEEMLSIVIYVIESKQADNEAARTTAARRAEKDQLLEILHDKKKSELLGLSTEELERRIAALSS